jgi:hypothetical protein
MNQDLSSVSRSLAKRDQFVCVLHPNDCYGPHYVEDLHHATIYSDARLFGRHTYFTNGLGQRPSIVNPGWEFQRVSSAPSGSIMVRADLLKSKLVARLLFERWLQWEHKEILSLSRYGYVWSEACDDHPNMFDKDALDA